MGTLSEEKAAGKMATKWHAFVKGAKGVSTSNAARGLQTLLSAKDAEGVVRAARGARAHVPRVADARGRAGFSRHVCMHRRSTLT